MVNLKKRHRVTFRKCWDYFSKTSLQKRFKLLYLIVTHWPRKVKLDINGSIKLRSGLRQTSAVPINTVRCKNEKLKFTLNAHIVNGEGYSLVLLAWKGAREVANFTKNLKQSFSILSTQITYDKIINLNGFHFQP